MFNFNICYNNIKLEGSVKLNVLRYISFLIKFFPNINVLVSEKPNRDFTSQHKT